MSQRDLAQAAGVPQSTIARIESKALSPRVETLTKIGQVLGLEVEMVRSRGAGVDRSQIRQLRKLKPMHRIRRMARSARNLRSLDLKVGKVV